MYFPKVTGSYQNTREYRDAKQYKNTMMKKRELPGFSMVVGAVVLDDVAVPGFEVLGLAVVAVVLVVVVACFVVVVAGKYRICTFQK